MVQSRAATSRSIRQRVKEYCFLIISDTLQCLCNSTDFSSLIQVRSSCSSCCLLMFHFGQGCIYRLGSGDWPCMHGTVPFFSRRHNFLLFVLILVPLFFFQNQGQYHIDHHRQRCKFFLVQITVFILLCQQNSSWGSKYMYAVFQWIYTKSNRGKVFIYVQLALF